MTNAKKGYKISFLIVLIAVVLSFCICIGSVLAWLRVGYTSSSEGLVLGSVKLELYNGSINIIGTHIETDNDVNSNHYTIEIPASENATRELGVRVRNVGTIDCLVRATISLYYTENNGDSDGDGVDEIRKVPLKLINSSDTIPATTSDGFMGIKISHADWIPKFPNASISVGELYYNEKLQPYMLSSIDDDGVITSSEVTGNAKYIISSITTHESEKSRTLYMDVTVDAIAYSGNIYKKIANDETSPQDIPVMAYPFGEVTYLPEDWDAYL